MAWHARLSASQTKQWWECPGSTVYLENNPDLASESGTFAREGTCAHFLLETCLLEDKRPADFLGLTIRIPRVMADGKYEDGEPYFLDDGTGCETEMDFEVSDDMAEAVDTCVSYVRGRLLELTGNDSTAEAILAGALHVEKRVNPLPERDDTGGTGDIIIDVWPELMEVIDYKHGKGVFVPVQGNKQLRSYMMGAIEAYDAHQYEAFRYTISQPRHMNAPRNGIMSEDVTPKEMLAWQKELRAAAARVDKVRAFYTEDTSLKDLYEAGFVSVGQDGAHCTFCDLKAWCPAIAAKAQEVAAVDFADDLPERIDSPGHNQLAMALPWVPLLDSWIKELEAAAERELMAGNPVPGFKLVQGKANRILRPEYASDEKKLEQLAVEYGAPRDKLYTEPKPPAIKTGPQLEKLVPAKRREEFAQKAMYKPPGKLTVAPEADSRPAVKPGQSVEDDFKDEEI